MPFQVRTQKPDDVVYRFLDTFPSAVVKERHYHKVAFQIQTGLSRCRACDDDARGAMSLSQIFKFLEESSSALAIDDYSVSQTTLDDVFVNFAEKQRNAEAEQVLSPWKRRLSSIVSAKKTDLIKESLAIAPLSLNVLVTQQSLPPWASAEKISSRGQSRNFASAL